MQHLRLFIAVLGYLFITLGVAPSYAADRPNILIMGEDVDEDTVPRKSRVFKRVLNALSNQLHDVGFDVYDETAVTLGEFVQGNSRRDDAELIDIGRSIQQPPIDVVVIFSIYASIDKKDHISKLKSRVEGRLLQVKSGQRLGNFEVKAPNNATVPVDCSRECILENVGDEAKILASDVGAVLSEKLAWMVGEEGDSQLANGFTLTIDGFSPEEVMDMEEYLVIFSGYMSHRPIYSTPRRSEIWYQSTIDSAKLLTNLKRVLKELELSGMVLFSGNAYTIRKTKPRKKKKVNTEGW